MMPVAYLDTSAFLKLFLDEPESELVAKAVEDSAELIALRLVLTEARVTLARLHRDGQLDRSQYLTTLDAVASYWETQVQVLEWTEEVFRSAEHLAETQPGLRTLDALHVGAARTQRLGSRPEAMAFISCDLRLLKAAASIGFLTPIPPGKG
jgi:predicted nucleic acid-binding protein